MIKPNPFTPKSGLEPKVFINRDNEIKLFLKRINEAKNGITNHYIINGIWGSGKTSLLRYFKLIAQEQNCFASYFLAREITENTSDIEICTHIVQSLLCNIPFITFEKNSNVLKTISGFGFQIFGSSFNLTFKKDDNMLIDPQIFLSESLLNIWKDISKKTDSLVVLIDDAQNYSKVKRIFTTLKNVLSEDEIIKNTKILFILSSTIEGWEEFIKINHPIGRFFIPRIELSNFSQRETIGLIDKILKGSGVTFSSTIKEKIFKYSQGHLFQIHALGSVLYDNQKSGKVTETQWERGFEEGLYYLGNTVYDGIIKGISENEIKIITNLNPEEVNKLEELKKKIKIKGLNVYLSRLAAKNIIKFHKRGEYILGDRLLFEFIKKTFNK